MSTESDIEDVVAVIKQSKKYRDTSEETIRLLASAALKQHKKPKRAIKAIRKRLHSIMAPYLGDPDYETVSVGLTAAFTSGDEQQIKQICWDALYSHLSTRERLPIMEDFYQKIFQITGIPHSLLDIACGLNPLALPWMNLPQTVQYHAYDIHEPRIDFINHYFRLLSMKPLAKVQDVALRFPEEKADIALFLKEMPRFERNYPGTGRDFLAALPVRYLVVSFPSVSTHGGRNLISRYQDFFSKLVADRNWQVTDLLFEGELVFVARKPFRVD